MMSSGNGTKEWKANNLPPNQCHIPQLDSLCLILDSSHQLFVAMLMNWSIKYTCALCSTKTSQLLIHPRTKVDMASSPYSFSSTVSIFLFLLLALLTVSATRAEVAAAAAPVDRPLFPICKTVISAGNPYFDINFCLSALNSDSESQYAHVRDRNRRPEGGE